MHIILNCRYRISMTLPSGVIAKEQTNVFSCKGHFFKNRSQEKKFENIQKCSEIQIYKQIHKHVKNTNIKGDTRKCYWLVRALRQVRPNAGGSKLGNETARVGK